MRKGPVGNRGAELASLRLAASARDLIDAGSLDGAAEALGRALSLYGANGYAYLYLAYVRHVQGRGQQAAEFAASARRYLPRDEAVQAELEALTASIRRGAVATGS
jgi:tetratricopeptide (TPR) repeat protein